MEILTLILWHFSKDYKFIMQIQGKRKFRECKIEVSLYKFMKHTNLSSRIQASYLQVMISHKPIQYGDFTTNCR
jgi:hypothetical protein